MEHGTRTPGNREEAPAFGADSLEQAMRLRIRDTIEELVKEELEAALGAPKSARVGEPRQGYRQGARERPGAKAFVAPDFLERRAGGLQHVTRVEDDFGVGQDRADRTRLVRRPQPRQGYRRGPRRSIRIRIRLSAVPASPPTCSTRNAEDVKSNETVKIGNL